MKNNLTMFLFFCTLFIVLPLNIINLTLNNISTSSYNYLHIVGILTTTYGLVLGITYIVSTIILTICYILMLRNWNVITGIIFISILNGTFGFVWIAIGTRLLYVPNNIMIVFTMVLYMYFMVLYFGVYPWLIFLKDIETTIK
jgi:hypothetical protein